MEGATQKNIFWPSVSVMLNDDCLSQLIQARNHCTRLIQAQSGHPGGPDNLRYPLGAPPAASARFWGRLVGDSLRLRPDVL